MHNEPEMSIADRAKSRQRGCFVAIGYIAVLVVLSWLALR